MRNHNRIKYGLAAISIVLLAIIALSTINVLSITKNPSFSIDFENKHQIIIGYASLVGAILTFLSIIFVLYNIIQQHYQFEEEKKLTAKKELNSIYSRIPLVYNSLSQIISHINEAGDKIEEFSNSERRKPLNINFIKYQSLKKFYRILELEYNTLFKAFQRFLPNDKEKHFNNLYSLTDFYSESLQEIKEIIAAHQSDKRNKKIKIIVEIRKIIDLSSDILVNIEEREGKDYLNNTLYQLIDKLISDYQRDIENNNQKDIETDLENISHEIFLPFIKKYLDLTPKIKTSRSESLLSKISNIRKDINSIKKESEWNVNHIQELQREYYSESSIYLNKLEEIKNQLKLAISNRTIDDVTQ